MSNLMLLGRTDHCFVHKLGAETTLDFRKPENKHIKYNDNSGFPCQSRYDAAPEGHQNRLKLFLILFILHVKQGEVSKSDPSEIRFPMTLTSGAFLNQKTNYKQTSLE